MEKYNKKLCQLFVIVLILYNILNVSGDAETCPRRCTCDMWNAYRRASCTKQRLVNINAGVPNYVQILQLSNNSILTLDDYEFQHLRLTQLVYLNLGHNSIHMIGLDAFAGLGELKTLDLSYNRLQNILKDTFWHNKNLTKLVLKGNKFRNTENVPFLESKSLRMLDLSYCFISHVSNAMFTKLPSLFNLNLSGNMLIQISKVPFVHVTRLHFLNLNNNSWTCNGKMFEFENWIKIKGIQMDPQCGKARTTKKMFERMVIAVESKEEEIEIHKVWDKTDNKVSDTNNNLTLEKTRKYNTLREKFNNSVPSDWSLIFGFVMGILFGVLGTYLVVNCSCKWPKTSCRRIQTRRQIRRQRRVDNQSDANVLLWANFMNNIPETPPARRARPEVRILPSRGTATAPEQAETPSSTLRSTNRNSWAYLDYNSGIRPPGTPPPPYTDVVRN